MGDGCHKMNCRLHDLEIKSGKKPMWFSFGALKAFVPLHLKIVFSEDTQFIVVFLFFGDKSALL
jgi:hypothetical protein